MNNLAEKNNILDITPDTLDNALIDSLNGYENITVYNNIIRLIPFKDAINSDIKEYGKQAIETINYWMTNIETPFGNTFLAIKTVFLEEDTLEDLEKELKAYRENKTFNKLKEINDITKEYEENLKKHQGTINDTNAHVDKFRQLIAIDSQNFQDIEKKLPDIIKDNNDKITEKKEKIKEVQTKITELTTDIRKKQLEIEEIDSGISKAGIACAIPIVNFGGAIAMAVLLGKKSAANSELRNLEDELERKKTEIIQLNSDLYGLNKQAPLLTSMCAQIPNLYTLSITSAEVAQKIKRAWDDINYGLNELITTLEKKDEKTDRALSKLPKKINSLQQDLTKTLEKYERSKNLGIPVDENAQKVFKLSPRLKSNYYYSSSQSGLLYVPVQELYTITANFCAS
ncbi:MAG: hypothetical protein V4471_02600 [Pseudomonadota bacterium]